MGFTSIELCLNKIHNESNGCSFIVQLNYFCYNTLIRKKHINEKELL